MLFDFEGLEEVAIVGYHKPAGYWLVSEAYRIDALAIGLAMGGCLGRHRRQKSRLE